MGVILPGSSNIWTVRLIYVVVLQILEICGITRNIMLFCSGRPYL